MAVTSILDFILETAQTDRVGAGVMLTQSLMAGDKATLTLGYTFANALNAAANIFNLSSVPLSTIQLSMVAEAVAKSKGMKG